MSTKADDAQERQPSPPSLTVGNGEMRTAKALGEGTYANRPSTELLFEAPKTPHKHHQSVQDVQDIEGELLDDEQLDLDEPKTVERAGTSVDGTTYPTAYSASQATSNSPPIVLKSLPTTPITSGHTAFSTQGNHDDEDASKLLISSLRTQLTDLHNQLEMLNSKLISSYSRISSLEDDLYLSTSNLESTQVRLKSLEQQRQSHVKALQSGVLVERAAIATELSKLMERATEEERKRGEEEGKRKEIERELFDLSAGLFGQANAMVADERIARASAQRRVEECEAKIYAQSKQVNELESTLRVLKEERNEFEREVGELQGVVKAVDRNRTGARRLRTESAPYKEYVAFVEHLRALVPSSPTPPAISTLLTLPFLARLVTEDSEPTLRLDTAPSLNWLSRRSVLSAIHHAQLVLEDLHIATLFLEANALYPNSSSSPANAMLEMQMGRVKKVSCALCGKVVWALPIDEDVPTEHEGADKWNAPKFLKDVVAAGSSLPISVGMSQTRGRVNKRAMVRPASPPPPMSLQSVIPIFRIITSSSSMISHTYNVQTPIAPGTSATPQSRQRSAPYPLCANGWCKERLRTTIELWKFLREHVVERIWEDEIRSEMIIAHQLTQEQRDGLDAPILPPKMNKITTAESAPLPLVPPRKKLAGLWEAISGSASPANGSSPTTSHDTNYSTGVASRGINIGGLTSGLGGFLGRMNSTPNAKVDSSREHSPSPTPLLSYARSTTSFLGAGVPHTQGTEEPEEKEKQALGVPVKARDSIANAEQAEEGGPPLVERAKEVKSEPPLVGSAPFSLNPPDRKDVLSPGDCADPSRGITVPPHAEMLAEVAVAKSELEAEVKAESRESIEGPPSELTKALEPKTETKIDSNEPVPEALAPTEDSKSTPAPATPARNPARVVPFGGADTAKTDSSRPTTPGATIGAPPPVPRRAAARVSVRPGSTLVAPDILRPPPPRSERRAGGNVGGEGQEKKEEIGGEKQEAKVEAEGNKEITVVRESVEEIIDVAPVITEEAKKEPKVETEVIAGQESLIAPGAAADTATPNTPINPPSPLPEPTVEPAPEAAPAAVATETTHMDLASILSESSASVYTKDTKDLLPPIPATVAAEGDSLDDDEWVSNARWEDRAWNEIIRLRKGMFWARVGSGIVNREGLSGLDA